MHSLSDVRDSISGLFRVYVPHIVGDTFEVTD